MTKASLSLLILGFFQLPSLLFSQSTEQRQRLDSLERILSENQQVKGSYCIYKDGELYAKGNIGNPKGDWNYRIGSISKTYTASLMLKADEEGKLSLQDPLSKYFPQIANADSISLEMLLNHRSGIHNFTDDPSYTQIMHKPQSRADMLKRFAALEPDFSPNSDFKYSNTNYVLASYILEDIYGQPIADILEEKIARPFKLEQTYFFETEKRSSKELDSYYWTGEWNALPSTHPSLPLGAGGIVSQVEELCQFMRLLHRAEFISKASVAKMKGDESYGLGLMQFPFYERRAYGHNGGIDGFQSHASYFPEEDLAIALCLNGSQYPLNDLLIDLLSIYFQREDYSLPEFKTVDLSEAELQKYCGVYKSANFPLDISIKIENGQLMGQATGQPAFPLNSLGEDQFEFKSAGIKMSFDPQEDLLLFEQMGRKVRFSRSADEK